MSVSAAVITKPTFTLADRLKIQRDRMTNSDYKKIGFLTTIVLEQQMSTRGMSSSRAIERCSSPEGVKKLMKQGFNENLLPFSPWQAQAWTKLTLEWLLLPFGLAPLPDIPDPAWIPKKAGDVAPRIPQKLEDRAYGQIRERSGKLWLIFQPLRELCVFIGGEKGGMGRITCMTDPADRTHSALLVHPYPRNDGVLEAHFVGGSFHAGF